MADVRGTGLTSYDDRIVGGGVEGRASASTLRKAVSGDHEAFEQLIREHDRSLRTLAYRLVGDGASDALQEAYIRAFVALPGFDAGRGSVKVWLHRIVYRVCIDILRQPAADTQQLEDERHAGQNAVAADTLSILRDGLRQALRELTPEKRAAVVLVEVLGFDYADAAQALEIPEGTVASRLHSARHELKQALLDYREG